MQGGSSNCTGSSVNVHTQSCQLVLKRYPFISDGSDDGFRSDLDPDNGNVIPDQEFAKRCEFLRRWISKVNATNILRADFRQISLRQKNFKPLKHIKAAKNTFI